MNKFYSSTQQSLFSKYDQSTSQKGMGKVVVIFTVLFILRVFINP